MPSKSSKHTSQSKQRGLNSRSILHGNSKDKKGHLITMQPRDILHGKRKGRYTLESKPKQLNINDLDQILKAKSSAIQDSSSKVQENRFVIPNITQNFDLQLSFYERTHELLSLVMSEIEVRVPRSPSAGDEKRIEMLMWMKFYVRHICCWSSDSESYFSKLSYSSSL